MNAIISLCHFCETHGPSILFCTQSFHTPDPQHALNMTGQAGCGDEGSLSGRQRHSSADSTDQAAGSGGSKTDLCEACRSFSSSQAGFISNDVEAEVQYVSSQHPHHPRVFTMVRTACLRSLSCEVCPGREGPIFFGDEQHGHVLSHTFLLEDSQARGLSRYYSVIVVMMDKIFLLNSWPFLVTNIRNTIQTLQTKASKVYSDEQAKFPQRIHRLGTRYHGNKSARSLVDLTNDKLVFHRLHQSFTWILKAGGSRLTERLLEGPPTEDTIIDMEKQEETEDGFVILHSIKDTTVAEEETVVNEAQEEEEDDVPVFSGLRHLLKVLGYQSFHVLAYHVVIGNQVIIRCDQRAITNSIINSLKVLLPRGCCRVISHSLQYEDSWRCNFLGLPLSVALPQHTELYVSVQVTAPSSPAPVNPDLSAYTFLVSSPKTLPEKVPAVLNKMEFALLNEAMADSVVEQCLISLKEEWMNKVKVLFKFTKAGGGRSEEDTRRLLTVVGVNNEDKVVLQFWMTGLSVQYRNHMLSSAISHMTIT